MAKAMSDRKITRPSADSLAESAKALTTKGLPPIHSWNPPFCGDIDMHIKRDGSWIYEGGVIERAGLVRLFSTILKKEGDRYYLVTPVEKVGITVEDAPFVAIDVDAKGEGPDQVLQFETNVGDNLLAGKDNPIRVERDPETGEPAPYVLVRDNLEALIDRKSFYRLVEMGVHHADWFGVWSGGSFFGIIPSEELANI